MISEGGKMTWMPCSMQRVRCRRYVSSDLFVAPMKSSTNTSIIFTGFEGIYGCRDCGITIVSNLWQGSVVLLLPTQIWRLLQFLILNRRKVAIHTIQFKTPLVPQVLPSLVIQVIHRLQGGRIRSSTPGYVIQPATKSLRQCLAWWIWEESLGHNYLP